MENETTLKDKLIEEKKIEVSPDQKRGRGRPLGSTKKTPSPPVPEVTPEQRADFINQFALVSNVVLDLLAPRLPNPIPFTAQEKEMFSSSLTPVVNKYFKSFGAYDAEISLAITSIILFYPRLKKEESKKSNESKENKTTQKTIKETSESSI